MSVIVTLVSVANRMSQRIKRRAQTCCQLQIIIGCLQEIETDICMKSAKLAAGYSITPTQIAKLRELECHATGLHL